MTDLAQLPTSALPLVDSDPTSQPDPAIAHLDALFSRLKEDQLIIEKQVAEIETLRKELADLRAGKHIIIGIEGRTFVIKEDVQPLNGHKSGLEDSFVL